MIRFFIIIGKSDGVERARLSVRPQGLPRILDCNLNSYLQNKSLENHYKSKIPSTFSSEAGLVSCLP